jgi:phosphatidylserine decarboxylase
VFDFDIEGGGKAWVVMVGAFNVGRMATRLEPNFVTNAISRQISVSHKPQNKRFSTPVSVAAGEELGIFMLGSTTIVILDDAARQNLNPREVLTPSTVVMGQNLSQ